MRILPMGRCALLVDELDDPAGWAVSFAQMGVDGVVDVVPAARTVLVVAESASALAAVRASVPDVVVDTSALVGADEVVIEVDYAGPDLPVVADAAAMSVEQVVDLHCGAPYRVAFCGFAPGFAYLSGLPTPLHLPRRSTPRTKVPAGSVAIASEYAAVYPTASPGGWHLIGSTSVSLFDVRRDPPARLMPGTSVKFVPR